jgi:uncharacterized protein (DUF2164 family)
MYIEMTTFAIPTFLITLFKIAAALLVSWIVLAMIGIWFYDRGIRKAIKRDNEKCAKRMRGERIL